MPPSRTFPRALGALVVLLLAAAGSSVPARAATGSAPVTLVETRPVESTLGDPELPAALDVWLELIGGARKRLDIEQFYISDWPNEPMRPVLDAIGAAARRGVDVRIVIDAGMHATYPQPADSLAKLHGIRLRMVDYKRLGGGVQHAKFFIVDGATVYLGSQNTDWRALKHIHELGVRVRDARVARVFEQVFDMDWAAADTSGRAAGRDTIAALRAGMALAMAPALPFTLVQAPGDTVRLWPSYNPRSFIPVPSLWDRDALERLIDGARTSIVVQSLTYGIGGRRDRDSTLDVALRRAAARGVKVRLVISDWETGGMPDLQRLAGVANVGVKLSTVPEWSGGYIPFGRVEHCKYAVADGERVWVGTSNWEPDYFLASRNLAVTLDNHRLAQQAMKVFETSWSAPGAHDVRPDGQYPRKSHGETSPDGRPVYGH